PLAGDCDQTGASRRSARRDGHRSWPNQSRSDTGRPISGQSVATGQFTGGGDGKRKASRFGEQNRLAKDNRHVPAGHSGTRGHSSRNGDAPGDCGVHSGLGGEHTGSVGNSARRLVRTTRSRAPSPPTALYAWATITGMIETHHAYSPVPRSGIEPI